MNFLVIVHGCWLVAMLTRRRRAAIARLWPNYCLFLVIFFLYQYLLCLGMPPALCMGKGHGGHCLPALGRGWRKGLALIVPPCLPQIIRGAGAIAFPSTRRSSSGSTCLTSSRLPNPPTSSVSRAPCPCGALSPYSSPLHLCALSPYSSPCPPPQLYGLHQWGPILPPGGGRTGRRGGGALRAPLHWR